MSGTQGVVAGVAGRYAKALFELAEESGSIDAVAADAKALGEALETSDDFRRALTDPSISRDTLGKVAAAVAAKISASAITAKTMGLMAAKGRLGALGPTMAAFEALAAEKRGERTAHVASATPLTDAQRSALANALSKSAGGKSVHMQEEVDPDLIGGLVVRMGSVMIDSSIRTKLSSLQQSMKEVG